MYLSVVVPCFNEVRRLARSVAEVEAYLRARGGRFELILVDDGSTDGTGALIEDLARERASVRAEHLPRNRGKGRAVARGVCVSLGDRVLVSDADFSAPIDEMEKLGAAIAAGADIAFGSRALPGAFEIGKPVLRRLMGKTFNRLVQVLLLPGVWDTQCGFKLFRGPVARELFRRLRTDGFAFDVEVLYQARRSGYKLREVPVRWINSDLTHVRAVRHSAQMLRDLARLRLAR